MMTEPVIRIEPGTILMDKLPPLPYYGEQLPHLFVKVVRVKPKMIDVTAEPAAE
jgi:hypothetical protein